MLLMNKLQAAITTLPGFSEVGREEFKGLKVERPLMSGRMMGQVYCTKWNNSLLTKYTYI